MVNASLDNLQCKVCGSHLTVRDGKIKGIQRWKCKSCGRKFLDNHARQGMKTPIIQVHAAIVMYYQGVSLNTICKQLQQRHANFPSVSTVYEWVSKYSRRVLAATRDFHPEVGDTWIADETVLNFWGKQVWIWDITDKDTCFLLASRVAAQHDTADAQLFMDQAIEKAGKSPGVVIADRMGAYLSATRLFNSSGGNIPPLSVQKSADEVSKFHATLQWRTDLMSDLKRMDKVVEFVDGWLIYYNYFRPQESLGGKTPAEIAKLKYTS